MTRPQERAQPAETDELARVAEFLARTAEYQLPSPPPVDTPRRSANESLLDQIVSAQKAQGAPPAPSQPQAPALPVLKAVTVVRPALPPAVRPGTDVGDVNSNARNPQNTVNLPLGVSAPESAPAWTVESVLDRLEEQTADGADLDAVWQLTFARLAFHRDTDAAELPPTLSGATREILGSLVKLVPMIRAVLRDRVAPGNDALAGLDALRRRLLDRCDPIVSKIALCRKVITFGRYEELAPSDFVAGRENQAIVYTEVRNLRAEQIDGARYVSKLGTRLEVLTTAGNTVWRHEEPEIIDESRSRRTDFFVAERITLPSTLAAGEYILKVMVEDKLAERMSEASLPLTINAVDRVADSATSTRAP